MDLKEQNKITLVVRDEEDLYTAFSPEPEFCGELKTYIRSKVNEEKSKNGIQMTVVAEKPIDEERFRIASSNWNKDAKKAFKIQERQTLLMLIALLAVGSLLIIVSLALEKYNNVLKYSILPVIGSLALSRAAAILLIDLPTMRATKWILNEMDKKNVLSFEYQHDKNQCQESCE